MNAIAFQSSSNLTDGRAGKSPRASGIRVILIQFLALMLQLFHAMETHVAEPKVQGTNRLLGVRMFFALLLVLLARDFWEENAPFQSLLLMALIVKVIA